MLKEVNFILDANKIVGLGHLMRCLPIALEFKKKSYKVKFWGNLESLAISELDKHHIHYVSDFSWSSYFTFRGELQRGILFLDNYQYTKEMKTHLKQDVNCLIGINDSASYENNYDYLIDYTLGRKATDYNNFVPEETTVLAGEQLYPLRDDFKNQKPRAKLPEKISHVAILFGGADKFNASGKCLDVLLKFPLKKISLYIADQHAHKEDFLKLEKMHSQLSVQVGKTNIASELLDVDLFLGAPGISNYERWYLKIPSIVISTAWNHLPHAELFHQYKIAYNGGTIQDYTSKEFAALFEKLMQDHIFFQKAFEGLYQYTLDGNGAQKIVEAITTPHLNPR